MSRVPTYDLATERALLACELLEPGTLEAHPVGLADWYDRRHQVIAAALMALRARGVDADGTSLRAELVHAHSIARAGGDDYLLSLTLSIPAVASAPELARVVRDYARARALAEAFARGAAHVEAGEYEEARSIASELGVTMADSGEDGDRILTYGELMADGFEEAILRPDRGVDIRFGTASVDADYRPSPGHLIVVAGRPNVGKTSLTWAWHMHSATSSPPIPSGVVSVDDGSVEYGVRALGPETGINPAAIWQHRITANDIQRLANAIQNGAKARPIFFSRSRDMTIDSVCAIITRMVRVHGCRWVSVDFITKIKAPGKEQRDRTNEAITRLGILASQLQIPIVLLAQLRRLGERAYREPHIDDLKESGRLEEDAQCVVMLWRESDQPNAPVLAKVAKAKRVPAGRRFALGRHEKTGLVVETETRGGYDGHY